ncbi:hypothetical protein BCR32DRAFT_289145 [Anaeromyces robustus]|uniref:Amino acid transporter transmembrane domain-containing protein n=1 Tax=Anaeromyces robustus TaxID=1754192 RepID=A0A1Y1XPI3_9FUNG|nr:hypothetical protein BCR32DRAFT_289145 [Anaeromyces robustus]|eukprot:ORX87659.1 hypothetical protein BCR32DRAFT_289145 [Anaeromyces robustus]
MDTQIEPVISNNQNSDNHNNEENGTFFSSILSLSNTMIGTGILSLPFTISNTGLTFGIILFILSGYITKLSLCMYIDIAKIIAPNKYDIKISALSEMINMPKWGVFINIIIIFNCFGTATSLLIASSDFILSLFKNLLSSDYTGILLDKRFWITMEIIIILPIIFRKTLASLKFFSFFSIISISYLTIAIIFSYFRLTREKPEDFDPISQPQPQPQSPLQSILEDPSSPTSTSNIIQQCMKKFMAISIIIFAYGCQQNIFPIYSELKPSNRPYISHIIFNAVFFCTIVYLTIGYCGYATFGDKVQSNVLNNYENSDILINIARFAMAIYCTFTYSVQMHPCRESVKNEYITFKIKHQKDYDNINENDSDEKIKLLINQEQNYGSTSGVNNNSSSSNNNNNNNNNSNNSNTSKTNSSNNSNSIIFSYDEDEDEDEFESQIDANDADDERSSDSHHIKHINIDILDNLVTPPNTNNIAINNYDTESLFNTITVILIISSYLFAVICNDFGKILGLVGATCCSVLSFIYPSYLYIKITRGITFKRIQSIVLLILGVAIAVLGTIATILN